MLCAALAPVGVAVELVELDLAAQGVAVQAKDAGGAGLVAPVGLEHLPDEALLELGEGFVKQDPALHQLVHQGVQLVFHLSTPHNRRRPPRHPPRVACMTAAASAGPGACLFPPRRSSQSRTNCLSKAGWLCP